MVRWPMGAWSWWCVRPAAAGEARPRRLPRLRLPLPRHRLPCKLFPLSSSFRRLRRFRRTRTCYERPGPGRHRQREPAGRLWCAAARASACASGVACCRGPRSTPRKAPACAPRAAAACSRAAGDCAAPRVRARAPPARGAARKRAAPRVVGPLGLRLCVCVFSETPRLAAPPQIRSRTKLTPRRRTTRAL